MPGTDTGDLAETTMGLTGQAAGTPTGGTAFVTLTLGDADDIDGLLLVEDGVNGDLLLEELGGEVDLAGNITAVHLNFEDVGSLLALQVTEGGLGVADGANNGTVLLDALQLSSHLVRSANFFS